MLNNNDHKISEKELDNLLNQAFLNLDFNEPKNQKLMEITAQHVLSDEITMPIKTKKTLNLKLIIILSASLVITGITLFFLLNRPTLNTPPKFDQKIIVSQENTKSDSSEILTLKHTNELVSKSSSTINTLKESAINKETSLIEKQQPETNMAFSKEPEKLHTNPTKKYEDSAYIFPKLTEKEIKITKKQKEKIKNAILKQQKDRFALISPQKVFASSFTTNDTTASFYIQNFEVTNLEYRTFLFDLLLQDRKAEFLKAKPDQSQWINTLNTNKYDLYRDIYFSEKRFDSYPVVNISQEGAELYCNWLNELIKNSNQQYHVRLPYESEWIYAAKGGLKGAYPWGTDSIQNKTGCFLANFNYQESKNTLQNSKYSKCVKSIYKNSITTAGLFLGDSVLPVEVYAYNPNSYGLYCISGNVSEMTYNNINKELTLKGGSWFHTAEQCLINVKNVYSKPFKPNTYTGFRPVFKIITKPFIGSSLREDKQTGIPTISQEEIIANNKQKKLMIDDLIKLNKKEYTLIPTGTTVYKNDTISVQSFYMQTTEVTNLQYRTFLMDLLIQGKTNEYIEAKPDQEMWVKKFPFSNNQPMSNLYFSHPAYNDYPVVNISRKAAEMYCKWLTIETNKILKENNKPLLNDLRLPVDVEWAYAARNNANESKYANGHKFLRDSKGRYEINFNCFTQTECKFDTALKLYVPDKNKLNKQDLDRSIADDGGFHTVYSRSYQPNKYGLFCMAGNVSEMVYIFNKPLKKINGNGTKGGSWFSCDYYLEIDADEEFPNENGPSPLIGFRPVTTNSNK
jgi:formylglycine-generating enzyme required for sulfatase activity